MINKISQDDFINTLREGATKRYLLFNLSQQDISLKLRNKQENYEIQFEANDNDIENSKKTNSLLNKELIIKEESS